MSNQKSSKKIFILSDRYLDQLVKKVNEVSAAVGASTVSKASNALMNFKPDDIEGVLIWFSAGIAETELQMLTSFLFACKFICVPNNTKIVIYCSSPDNLTEISNIANDEQFKVLQLIILNQTDDFTDEDFVRTKLLSNFYSDDANIYDSGDKNPAAAMSNVIKRIKKNEPTEQQDGFSILRKLVEDASITPYNNLAISISDMLEGKVSSNKVKDDNCVSDIILAKNELSAKLKDVEEGSREYSNIKLQMDMLELLEESRVSGIKANVISKFIEDVKSEFDSMYTSIDLEEVKLQRLNIDEMKKERNKVEVELKSYFKQSSEKLTALNDSINVGSMMNKMLQLETKKSDLVDHKDVLDGILAINKTVTTDIKVLRQATKSLIERMSSETILAGEKFNKFLKMTRFIEAHQENLITELMNSKDVQLKVKTDLAYKLRVVCADKSNIGVSMFASGVAVNYENPLIIDARLNTSNLGYYCRDKGFFSMEDWIDSTIDDIAKEINKNKYNYILPESASLLLPEQADKTSLFSRLKTALEEVSSNYDIIIVLVEPYKPESSVFLTYTAITFVLSNTNICTFSGTRRLYNQILKNDNSQINFVIFTPTYENFSEKAEISRLGVSLDKLRVKSIPYLPVDKYKNVGKNVFYEMRLTANHFKF